MPKTLAAEPSLNPALVALKPRQVLICRVDMVKEEVIAKESITLNLKSEQKVLVLRSIAQYLERCGFSKCFKKLLSEAQIEKKELNGTLPDVEEVYIEFFSKRQNEAVEVNHESKDAGNVEENVSDDHETGKKDKKKKKKEAAVNGIAEANVVEDVEKVKKEKKKKKEVEVTEEEKVKEANTEIEDGLKDKKKKKKKSKSIEAESLGSDDKEKVSKKRKRSEPEEEKEETEDDDEESKRRKKEDNVEDGEGVQETPVKQIEIQQNGNVEESETKSTGKGLSNSKEPKKPFQRVKVEEVVFTDDRLKDNSYWAKEGADSGYGAKAQEVLGQVKGRGFRHEKTKKKRGSYRGGEIDLQSHSFKFDYSDEE